MRRAFWSAGTRSSTQATYRVMKLSHSGTPKGMRGGGSAAGSVGSASPEDAPALSTGAEEVAGEAGDAAGGAGPQAIARQGREMTNHKRRKRVGVEAGMRDQTIRFEPWREGRRDICDTAAS